MAASVQVAMQGTTVGYQLIGTMSMALPRLGSRVRIPSPAPIFPGHSSFASSSAAWASAPEGSGAWWSVIQATMSAMIFSPFRSRSSM